MNHPHARQPAHNPTRTVLLEHTTPDGPAHLDWLIERPGVEAEHRLIAFRCAHDPTTHPEWRGERIADHRALYLDFEGPLSGDRGVVRRIWSARCRVEFETEDAISLSISTREGRTIRGHISRSSGETWAFHPG